MPQSVPLLGPSPRVHQHHSAGARRKPRPSPHPRQSRSHRSQSPRPPAAPPALSPLCTYPLRPPPGAALQNAFQHRQQPRLLFLCTHDRESDGELIRATRTRTRPRALRAQVQKVRSFAPATEGHAPQPPPDQGKSPPSLNESGVRFTTPITSVRRPNSSVRVRSRHSDFTREFTFVSSFRSLSVRRPKHQPAAVRASFTFSLINPTARRALNAAPSCQP